MHKITTNQRILSLSDKINSIENILNKTSQMVSKILNIGNTHNFIIQNGINGFKQKILDDFSISEISAIKSRYLAVFKNDQTLRHPHWKILLFLLDQYDYEADKFNQVHFSKIVKECHLGKNKAGEYLNLLTNKGYLKRKPDGYRVWYSIEVISD